MWARKVYGLAQANKLTRRQDENFTSQILKTWFPALLLSLSMFYGLNQKMMYFFTLDYDNILIYQICDILKSFGVYCDGRSYNVGISAKHP